MIWKKSTRAAICSLSLSLLTAATAGTAPLRHGCGYRPAAGAQATWWSFGRPTLPATRVPLEPTALPWGSAGSGSLNNTLYLRRYAGGDADLPRRGGMTPQGEANERAWHTAAVLTEGCHAGLFGAGWDCAPTKMEIEDYAFTVQRGTGLYRQYACLFMITGCR